MSRWLCKDYLRGICNNSFCEKWHPPECLYYKTKSGCRFGEKCAFAHRQVNEQPTKRSKKNGDKSAVAMLKKGNWQESVTDGCHDRTGQPVKRSDKKLEQNSSKRRFSDARQLGCAFQDMTPPKSILRKSTDMPKPIQRVKFTKAIARHTKIRDQNPSLGYICPGEPHERSPNAPKFEDRSQEETEWQEQGAREAAWKLAKNVFKSKEHERATFFSPSEKRCLPASRLKPEEREFVVDSGASMHMISKKDLSNAEMDTLTKSSCPTIVITANGEVQTHEEAIVYVKELDIFLTMKVLDNTPAVLSLGKLCDENGYSYEWINGQKPHLIKNGIRIICNTENFVPIDIFINFTDDSGYHFLELPGPRPCASYRVVRRRLFSSCLLPTRTHTVAQVSRYNFLLHRWWSRNRSLDFVWSGQNSHNANCAHHRERSLYFCCLEGNSVRPRCWVVGAWCPFRRNHAHPAINRAQRCHQRLVNDVVFGLDRA